MYNTSTYYPVEINSDCIDVYSMGKKIGKLNNGEYIYNIKGDVNNEYLVINHWDGPTLYSHNNTVISKGEKITTIYIGNDDVDKTVTSFDDIEVLKTLQNLTGKSHRYLIEGSAKFSKPIYGCYDGSIIATQAMGTIAYTENQIIFVSWKSICNSLENEDKYHTGVIVVDKVMIDKIKTIFDF